MNSQTLIFSANSGTRHPAALVESTLLGPGCDVRAFAHVCVGAEIGANVLIAEYARVEGGVKVGDRVTLQTGVRLTAGMQVEADVEIAANVTFAQGTHPSQASVVRSGATIGANATISGGVTLGARCRIMPGAVVTRDVPPNAIVAGNPAHIIGYVNTPHVAMRGQMIAVSVDSQEAGLPALNARRAALHKLPKIVDLRGALTFGEVGAHLPFDPKRFFMVYDVPSEEVRGEHAHKACHQFLVCVKGSCGIVVDDGALRDEVLLDSAQVGLHIPPMIWGIQYRFSPDAVLLVLASETYSAADYIRNYDEFLNAVRGGEHAA